MPAYYGFPKADHAYTPEEVGAALAASIVEDMDGLPRSGFLTNSQLVRAGSGWDVTVRPFKYVHADGGSVVIGGIDSATTLTLDAPGGVARTDVIAFDRNAVPPTVVDGGEGNPEPGDGESGDVPPEELPDIPVVPITEPGVVVVKGSSTTKPLVPAGMVEIATVSIGAGNASVAQASISHTYQLTGLQGQRLMFRTDTERDAHKPQVGQECEVLASGKRYSCISEGVWRQTAGQIGISKANWAFRQLPFVGRTVNLTLPTGIRSNETIRVSSVHVGSGYGVVSLRAVNSRSASQTQINVGVMQFGSATTQAFRVLWEVVPSGT